MSARTTMDELFALDAGPAGAEAALEISLHPRPPSLLFDRAAELDLPAGERVLDAGCRDGEHARRLATGLGREVIGIDLVHRNLVAAVKHPDAAGTAFVLGDLAALPLAAESFDLVWCRDTLELVADPVAAIAEFARVARPGGVVLLYTAWATELLEPNERCRLFSALSLSPAGADRATVERAIAAADLTVEAFEEISPEWAEHDLEQGGSNMTSSMLAIARLRRDRQRFVDAFGDAWYERLLAFEQWAPYLVLGKLQTGLWTLRRLSRADRPRR
jgi:SAM-dependent methyltransferase